MKCQYCDHPAHSPEYPFCDDHMLQGMGFNDDGECTNCEATACIAWQEADYNIPQAGVQTCPVCGKEKWFVANRCLGCAEDAAAEGREPDCPLLGRPLWAPGWNLMP